MEGAIACPALRFQDAVRVQVRADEGEVGDPHDVASGAGFFMWLAVLYVLHALSRRMDTTELDVPALLIPHQQVDCCAQQCFQIGEGIVMACGFVVMLRQVSRS